MIKLKIFKLKVLCLSTLLLNACSAGPRFALWQLPPQTAFVEQADHFRVQASDGSACAQEASQEGVIFYPGGLVHPAAYIPLAARLVSPCRTVLVAKMPLDLAVLNAEAAQSLKKQYPRFTTWWIGGHSLGGAMAAKAAKNGDYQGLFLLAAYPAAADDLSMTSLPVLSISASNDGLATPTKIEQNKVYLPANTRYYVVQGGNHAQFGDYGPQDKDGLATLSATAQQTETAQILLEFLDQPLKSR